MMILEILHGPRTSLKEYTEYRGCGVTCSTVVACREFHKILLFLVENVIHFACRMQGKELTRLMKLLYNIAFHENTHERKRK